jgi:hypothetical protein
MARRGGAKSMRGLAGHSNPRSLTWLQGLLCGALATLATPTALLVGVLLLPAIVASVLDRQPGKPIARSVGLFGLCGVIGPVRSLWTAGHTIEVATVLAVDLDNLLFAWGGAVAGWLLAELAPVAVRAVLEANALAKTARLVGKRAEYEKTWGFPPAPESPVTHRQ